MGGTGKKVGCGRYHENQICRLPKTDMFDLGNVGPHRRGDRLPGKGFPGWRSHKVKRRLGRDDADLMARLGQQPQQLTGFVSGYSAADAENETGQVDSGLCGRLGGQQAGVDLAHGDRERLLLRGGLHQGPDYSSRPSPSWL